jgi:hypothetical protein
LVSVDDVNILGEAYILERKSTGSPVVISKETGLEVIADKTKYIGLGALRTDMTKLLIGCSFKVWGGSQVVHCALLLSLSRFKQRCGNS